MGGFNLCPKCNTRHEAPTGSKCKLKDTPDPNNKEHDENVDKEIQMEKGAGAIQKVIGADGHVADGKLADDTGLEYVAQLYDEEDVEFEDEQSPLPTDLFPDIGKNLGLPVTVSGAANLPPFQRQNVTKPTDSEGIIKALLQQNQLLSQALIHQRVQQPTQQRTRAPPTQKNPAKVAITPPAADSTFLAEMAKLTSAVATLTNKVSELEKSKVPQVDEILSVHENEASGTTTPPTDGQEVAELREKMAAMLGLEAQKSIGYSTIEADLKKAGTSLKSGSELRAENEVVKVVPWPHMRLYRIPSMKGPDYAELEPAEFMFAYNKQMNDPENASIKPYMERHFNSLMDDFKDMPKDWERIRAFHSLILKHIERGWLTWDNYTEINIMRQKYLFAHINETMKVTPCEDYNAGTCGWRKDHGKYKHICEHCFDTFERECFHSKKVCFKLNGPPKAARQNTGGQGDKKF